MYVLSMSLKEFLIDLENLPNLAIEVTIFRNYMVDRGTKK